MGPITVTLLVVLGALLFMVLKRLFERPATPAASSAPAAPKQDLASLTVADARVGDNISIPGAGDNFSDLDFTVDHSNRYEVGEKKWFDLSGKHAERRVIVEVHNEDDELDVRGFLDGRKLSLEDLGVSEDDLAQMDQRQNTADNFEFDGKNWYYRLSKEIGAFHDGQAQGAGFYGWEFIEETGQRYLSIRKREGEPFSASVAVKLNPADITVYRP
jgi:nuclear transport factor 2 (NTF2) superfamily protein